MTSTLCFIVLQQKVVLISVAIVSAEHETKRLYVIIAFFCFFFQFKISVTCNSWLWTTWVIARQTPVTMSVTLRCKTDVNSDHHHQSLSLIAIFSRVYGVFMLYFLTVCNTNEIIYFVARKVVMSWGRGLLQCSQYGCINGLYLYHILNWSL